MPVKKWVTKENFKHGREFIDRNNRVMKITGLSPMGRGHTISFRINGAGRNCSLSQFNRSIESEIIG